MLLPGFPVLMGAESTPAITLTAGAGTNGGAGADFSSWRGFSANRTGKSFIPPQSFGTISAEPIPGTLCNNIVSTKGVNGQDAIVEFSGNVLSTVSKWKFLSIDGVLYPVSFSVDANGNTTYARINNTDPSGIWAFVSGTAYSVKFST